MNMHSTDEQLMLFDGTIRGVKTKNVW